MDKFTETKHMNIIFSSYGNDSVALMQWAHESKLPKVTVAYSDTGWCSDAWAERIKKGEELAKKYGFNTARIQSEGMEALVKRKKGWPQGGAAAFCTGELKVKPAENWMKLIDPEKEAICLVGIRREESANRRLFPEHTDESEKHGGRDLWAPLVRHLEHDRNQLLKRAGFNVLPHRSKECFPCVHANKSDIKTLGEKRIAEIKRIEEEMGFTKNGKARTIFRPARHNGAVGIEAVVNWAHNTHEDQLNLFGGCDSGWCGS